MLRAVARRPIIDADNDRSTHQCSTVPINQVAPVLCFSVSLNLSFHLRFYGEKDTNVDLNSDNVFPKRQGYPKDIG